MFLQDLFSKMTSNLIFSNMYTRLITCLTFQKRITKSPPKSHPISTEQCPRKARFWKNTFTESPCDHFCAPVKPVKPQKYKREECFRSYCPRLGQNLSPFKLFGLWLITVKNDEMLILNWGLGYKSSKKLALCCSRNNKKR
jgi:hypothetical protein